mgnify:CR=1 FL=1
MPRLPAPKLTLPNLPYVDDDELLPGELVVFPVHQSRVLQIRFVAPWEPGVLLDGERVTVDDGGLARQALMFVHGHLLALHRLLGDDKGAFAYLDGDGQGVITDVVDLQSGERMDHTQLRNQVGAESMTLPPFAVLGRPSSKAELAQRTRAMFATGTVLEVRGEDDGKVLQRRLFEVGRSDA